MPKEFLIAAGVCGALAGSIVVSVLATRDLRRGDLEPAAVVEETVGQAAPAVAPARAPARPAAAASTPQAVVPHPFPGPSDRGR